MGGKDQGLSPAVTLLDRYLTGELARLIVFGLVLFTIVWIAPEILFRLIQNWIDGDIGLPTLLYLLMLHLPQVLEQSIPMTAMIAGVFLSRQMSLHFEWIACLCGKISPRRLAVPVLVSSVALGTFHGVVQEWVTPITDPALTQAYQQADLRDAKRQNFVFLERNAQDPTQLQKFLLVGDIEGERLGDFFVLYYRPVMTGQQRSGSQIHRIFRAKRGQWDPATSSWRLLDGVEYELDASGVYKAIHPFKTQSVATSSYPAQLIDLQRSDPASFPLWKLGTFNRLLKDSQQTQDLPFYQVVWHQHLSVPLASILLLPLGILLGQEPPRTRKAWGLTSAVVVLFVYLSTIPFATNLGSLGVLPAFWAAWGPLTLATLVGLALVYIRRLYWSQ